MIPSPVTRVRVDTQIPPMLMRSTLFHPAQDKGHRLHEMLVSSAVEHIFNENAMHAKDNGKQSSGKGKQSKSWSMSDGKGKNKESKEKSKPRKLVIRS